VKIVLQAGGDVKGVSLNEKEVEELLKKNGFAVEKKQE